MYGIINFKFQTFCFFLVFGALFVGGCAVVAVEVAYAQFEEPAPPPEDFFTEDSTPPPPPEDFFTEDSTPPPPPAPGDTDFIGPLLPTDGPTAPVVPGATDTYIPLTPIPGAAPKAGTNLNTYIVGIFRLSVGVAAALAVLMIVYGGILYMTSEAGGGKAKAKEHITAALQGLGLILFASLLLYTIDPKILGENSFLPKVVKIKDPATLAQPPPPTVPHNCVAGTVVFDIFIAEFRSLNDCEAEHHSGGACWHPIFFTKCVPASSSTLPPAPPKDILPPT